jgi:hypothetical protein
MKAAINARTVVRDVPGFRMSISRSSIALPRQRPPQR